MADERHANEEEIPESVYLVISSQVFPITKQEISMGRKLDNDLVIGDELVSRNHAKIVFEGNQFVLYDNNSTGGSFVNNKRVDRCVLYTGDIILLANVPMMFINDAASVLDRSQKKTGSLK